MRPIVAGLRLAASLWRLVLAVFIVSVAVTIPARLIVLMAAGEVLGALPAEGLSHGELVLVLGERLLPVGEPLLLAVVTARLALWVWTVLWHAGAVRWFVYSGDRTVRLSELLSRGLMDWWRWARLGLTAVVVVVLGFGAVLGAHGLLEQRAPVAALYGAAVVSLWWLILCWLATLHGAWVLGEVTRSSAVLAWLAGLRRAVMHPIRSLLTLVAWAVPGCAVSALPLIAGWQIPLLREPVAGAVVTAAAGLFVAFCWVGLFFSFAPTSDGP